VAAGSALEVHHVVKRAQGGSDFDLDRLVALCPPCHAQTDAPYARGRLVITPLGDGRFTVQVIRGADKWAIQAEVRQITGPAPREGRRPTGRRQSVRHRQNPDLPEGHGPSTMASNALTANSSG
jgi:5-methylcytosine-specific restriction endonuclease McrA